MTTAKKTVGRPKKETTNTNTKIENKKVDEIELEKKETVKKVSKKEKLVLKDSDEIFVKSNVFGNLIYINHKTGDETIWENQGEVQPLTIRDLKDMKAKQLSFYKQNWISIIGSDDIDMEIYTIEDIYEALQVGRYYKDSVVPNDIDEIFDWTIDEMREKIKLMPSSIKQTIIVRANDKIKDLSLDSISKIKAIEEILECELTSPND